MALCQYRVTTSIGRVIITPSNRLLSSPPVIVGSNASCQGAGYQTALQYPDYCMYPGETIVSSVAFGCQGMQPSTAHDCINGSCLPQIIYNTPGVFANLAACQSGCAKNSNCTGECVTAEEMAALQQAASNVRTRLCGN